MAEIRFFLYCYFFAKIFPFENVSGRMSQGSQVILLEKESSSFRDFPVVCDDQASDAAHKHCGFVSLPHDRGT